MEARRLRIQQALFAFSRPCLHPTRLPALLLQNKTPKTNRQSSWQGQLLRIPAAPPRWIHLVCTILLRPTTEWGAGVWRPNRSDDSLQAHLLKVILPLPRHYIMPQHPHVGAAADFCVVLQEAASIVAPCQNNSCEQVRQTGGFRGRAAGRRGPRQHATVA
jgi:hypothetical protein